MLSTGIIPAGLNFTIYATVAQLAEQAFRKRQVKGSNPFGGSIVQSFLLNFLIFK